MGEQMNERSAMNPNKGLGNGFENSIELNYGYEKSPKVTPNENHYQQQIRSILI